MTLHAAKGLEFPLVFLAGLEEGLFPTPARFPTRGTRRGAPPLLCRMTRAMNTLVLTRAHYRRRYGNDAPEMSIPSAFLRKSFATGRKPRRTKPAWSLGLWIGLWRGAPPDHRRHRRPSLQLRGREPGNPEHPGIRSRGSGTPKRRASASLHRLLDDQPQPNSPVRNLLQRRKRGAPERRRDQIQLTTSRAFSVERQARWLVQQ